MIVGVCNIHSIPCWGQAQTTRLGELSILELATSATWAAFPCQTHTVLLRNIHSLYLVDRGQNHGSRVHVCVCACLCVCVCDRGMVARRCMNQSLHGDTHTNNSNGYPYSSMHV